MRTLDQEEIQEVNEILHERHPLYYEGLGLLDVFPILKYIPCIGSCVNVKVGEKAKRQDTTRILAEDIQRSDQPYDSNDDSK